MFVNSFIIMMGMVLAAIGFYGFYLVFDSFRKIQKDISLGEDDMPIAVEAEAVEGE